MRWRTPIVVVVAAGIVAAATCFGAASTDAPGNHFAWWLYLRDHTDWNMTASLLSAICTVFLALFAWGSTSAARASARLALTMRIAQVERQMMSAHTDWQRNKTGGLIGPPDVFQLIVLAATDSFAQEVLDARLQGKAHYRRHHREIVAVSRSLVGEMGREKDYPYLLALARCWDPKSAA